MKYPLSKYRFYRDGNRVIAVSTYAGKCVRGVAVCHDNDEFDFELGKRIAAAKCNLKIALKREARARKQLDKAQAKIDEANKFYADMSKYLADAKSAVLDAHKSLEGIANLG